MYSTREGERRNLIAVTYPTHPMTKLATEVKYLEECLSKSDPALKIEVTVTASVNDDVPDGFVESSMVSHESTVYEKVIDAKDGIKTKIITLYIRD